jgi:hypothetical protein
MCVYTVNGGRPFPGELAAGEAEAIPVPPAAAAITAAAQMPSARFLVVLMMLVSLPLWPASVWAMACMATLGRWVSSAEVPSVYIRIRRS